MIFNPCYQGAPDRNRRNRSDIIRPSRKHSLFMRHHSYSSANTLFNSETVIFSLFPTQYTVMSSAYMYVSPEATQDGRSLENIANNVGPNTEPCGTPT